MGQAGGDETSPKELRPSRPQGRLPGPRDREMAGWWEQAGTEAEEVVRNPCPRRSARGTGALGGADHHWEVLTSSATVPYTSLDSRHFLIQAQRLCECACL